MATTSIVGAVKADLKTRLTALAVYAGVTVERNRPKDAHKRECFWFWGATLEHDIPSVKTGRLPREETARLRFAINAAKPGRSADDAETRVLALAAGLEDLVADKPNLDNLVSWIKVHGFDVGVTPQFEGWDGLITGELEYHARLT